MSNDRLGKVVIDELRLCFNAEPEFLEVLSSAAIGERIHFSKFSIIRTIGQHFKHYFTLLNKDKESVAVIYFGRYGDDDDTHLWLKIDNEILYNQHNLKFLLLGILATFPIEFNNITRLALAIDSKKNYVTTIKRMFRDENIKTIINGKGVKDRRKVLGEIMYIHQASLERMKNPSLTICQAEAVRNKAKGIVVQAYNKKAELCKSQKEYISEYYNHPKTLHRLEVRLNYNEIRDYYSKIGKKPFIMDILDTTLLTNIYYYHLGSVLRFSHRRKPIPWQEILGLSAQDNNIP
jgi:hypothetical protein